MSAQTPPCWPVYKIFLPLRLTCSASAPMTQPRSLLPMNYFYLWSSVVWWFWWTHIHLVAKARGTLGLLHSFNWTKLPIHPFWGKVICISWLLPSTIFDSRYRVHTASPLYQPTCLSLIVKVSILFSELPVHFFLSTKSYQYNTLSLYSLLSVISWLGTPIPCDLGVLLIYLNYLRIPFRSRVCLRAHILTSPELLPASLSPLGPPYHSFLFYFLLNTAALPSFWVEIS